MHKIEYVYTADYAWQQRRYVLHHGDVSLHVGRRFLQLVACLLACCLLHATYLRTYVDEYVHMSLQEKVIGRCMRRAYTINLSGGIADRTAALSRCSRLLSTDRETKLFLILGSINLLAVSSTHRSVNRASSQSDSDVNFALYPSLYFRGDEGGESWQLANRKKGGKLVFLKGRSDLAWMEHEGKRRLSRYSD